MKTIHALSIALLLGAAAALGGLAGTRSVTSTHAQAANVPAAATFVASRSARLNRWQRQLQRALHRPLPKLPRLLQYPRVPVPAAPAPALAVQSAVPASRTIYVRAKASPAKRHHEREGDAERSDGGNHDD